MVISQWRRLRFFFKIISDTNISLNRIPSKCFGSNFDKNPRVIDHVTQKSCGVICMTNRNDSYTYCASILHLNLQWLFINSSSEKTSENNTEILRFFCLAFCKVSICWIVKIEGEFTNRHHLK